MVAPCVWKFPCGLCGKPVRKDQMGVQCEVSFMWLHIKCLGLTSLDYAGLQQDESSWCCPTCYRSALPFADSSTISSGNTSLSDSSLSDRSLLSSSSVDPGRGLSIYYTNCRSLLPKMDELRLLATNTKPMIIATTETWLHGGILPSEVAIPSYRLLRRDRTSRGGGICLYISECLSVMSPVCDD